MSKWKQEMVFAVVLALVLVQHFCCLRQGVGWCAALGAVGFHDAKRLHVKVEAGNGFCRGTCTGICAGTCVGESYRFLICGSIRNVLSPAKTIMSDLTILAGGLSSFHASPVHLAAKQTA